MKTDSNQPIKCPRCGSLSVERSDQENMVGFGIFFLLGFPQGLGPWMSGVINLICLDCGHYWEHN